MKYQYLECSMLKPYFTLTVDLRRKPVPYPRLTHALRELILHLVPSINNTFVNAKPLKTKLNNLRNSRILREHKHFATQIHRDAMGRLRVDSGAFAFLE